MVLAVGDRQNEEQHEKGENEEKKRSARVGISGEAEEEAEPLEKGGREAANSGSSSDGERSRAVGGRRDSARRTRRGASPVARARRPVLRPRERRTHLCRSIRRSSKHLRFSDIPEAGAEHAASTTPLQVRRVSVRRTRGSSSSRVVPIGEARHRAAERARGPSARSERFAATRATAPIRPSDARSAA